MNNKFLQDLNLLFKQNPCCSTVAMLTIYGIAVVLFQSISEIFKVIVK